MWHYVVLAGVALTNWACGDDKSDKADPVPSTPDRAALEKEYMDRCSGVQDKFMNRGQSCLESAIYRQDLVYQETIRTTLFNPSSSIRLAQNAALSQMDMDQLAMMNANKSCLVQCDWEAQNEYNPAIISQCSALVYVDQEGQSLQSVQNITEDYSTWDYECQTR